MDDRERLASLLESVERYIGLALPDWAELSYEDKKLVEAAFDAHEHLQHRRHRHLGG